MKVQAGQKMFLKAPQIGFTTEVTVAEVKHPAIGRCIRVVDAIGRESWVSKRHLEPAPVFIDRGGPSIFGP